MSVTFPDGIAGNGTTRIHVVPTIAATTYIPTLAEVNAGDDITCHFLAGAFQPGFEQPRVDDTRLCDQYARESFGRARFTLDGLQYIWDPQAAPGDIDNAAYEALVPGTTVYLVVRLGILHATAFAAAQKVQVFSANCGEQAAVIPGADEGAKHLVQQSLAITRVAKDVAIAA